MAEVSHAFKKGFSLFHWHCYRPMRRWVGYRWHRAGTCRVGFPDESYYICSVCGAKKSYNYRQEAQTALVKKWQEMFGRDFIDTLGRGNDA